MTGWLIGGIWLVALTLIPFVGRAIRNNRRHSGPAVIWDRDSDPWDRNPNGTYRLRGCNYDRHLQHQDLDDVDQIFGPITLDPPAGQDPAA